MEEREKEKAARTEIFQYQWVPSSVVSAWTDCCVEIWIENRDFPFSAVAMTFCTCYPSQV